MGGESKSQKAEEKLSGTLADYLNTFAQAGQQQITQGLGLAQPQINYNAGIVKAAQSGDYSGLLSAAGPAIGTITQTNQQAKEAIYNNLPAGPGRDAALTQAKMGEATDISTTLNQLFQTALTGNTQIGLQKAGIGLQETGAGLNAANIASRGYGDLMQAQAEGKASSLGLAGSVLGDVTKLGTSGVLGGAGGAGKAAAGGLTGSEVGDTVAEGIMLAL